MTNEEIYDVWAPPGAAWSAWCKPVLFAHMNDDSGELPRAPEISLDNLDGLPARGEPVVLVVDLPGPTSVAFGLELAARVGWRPVPLFNAAPPPYPGQPAQVEVRPTLGALYHGAERLRALELPPDAPPLFLLDVGRRTRSAGVSPYEFDNRSVSFPTDFPSANRLLASGLGRALVLHAGGGDVEPDLAHTLRGWQEAGITIWELPIGARSGARPLDVPKPSAFKSMLHRLLETAGLLRNVLGGYGGFPREPGSGFGAGG